MEVKGIVKDMKGGKEDMTENKRFRLGYVCGDYGLIDNDEWIDLHSMSENSEKNVKLCINKMNELADENEQLRKENDMFFCDLSVSANKEISRNCRIAELEEENEELKQYNTKLINKIDFLERVIDGDVGD